MISSKISLFHRTPLILVTVPFATCIMCSAVITSMRGKFESPMHKSSIRRKKSKNEENEMKKKTNRNTTSDGKRTRLPEEIALTERTRNDRNEWSKKKNNSREILRIHSETFVKFARSGVLTLKSWNFGSDRK